MESPRPRRTSVSPAVRLEAGFVPEAGAVPFPGYKLLRLRGRGAFASVYEASTPTNERIALKFMSSANAGGTTAREVRSLQGIQRLDHPYLLKIRNVWSMPNYIVIAMDLADASLLDLYLLYAEEFSKPIDADKVLLYLGQAADALDFLNAHRHSFDGKLVGFQHSDIKPNNILLIGDQALLADYGLATPMLGPMTPCFRQGTLDYAAPEVFQGTLSDSSDQFALAVSYYLLRTGSFPFPPPPKSPGRSFYRPPPDLSQVHLEERRVISRALSLAPADRYPSCSAFIDAVASSVQLELNRDADGCTQRVSPRKIRSGIFVSMDRSLPPDLSECG